MDTFILKTNDYKTSKWSGGQTTQILIYPKSSTLENRDFTFRVSFATIDGGTSEFSDFTGYNRYLTTLGGELSLDNGEGTRIVRPFETTFFDGGEKIISTSGPVTDFNLIIKKGITGSLRSESFKGEIGLRIFGGYNLIFIPEGNIRMTIDGISRELEAFDTIVAFDEEMTLETIENKTTKIIIVEAEVD